MTGYRVRHLAIIFGIALAGTASLAQAEGKKAATPASYHEIPLNIPAGAALKQSITHTKTQVKDGKTSSTTTQYETLNHITEGTDAYTVKKTAGPLKFLSSTEFDVTKMTEASPEYKLAQKMQMQMGELTYSTDDSLRPLKIKDWEKVRTTLTTSMKELLTAGAPEESRAQAAKAIDGMMNGFTAESAAEFLLPVDVLMSIPHNAGLELGVPAGYEQEIMVPLFNIPIQARSEVELTRWEPAQNRAYIRYDYAPLPVSLKSLVREGLPKFLAQMGAPADQIAKFNKELATHQDADVINLTTHCDYEMVIDTGLVSNGKCTKIVKIMFGTSGANKTETWEFKEALAN